MPSRVALAGLAGAGLLAAAAVIGAIRLAPLPTAATDDGMVAVRRAATVRPAADSARIPEVLVLSAVSRDPFRPDRQRPSERYLLPSERRPAMLLQRPVLQVRLIGTVMGPGGGAAALQQPGRAPRMLEVGDSIDGYRLLRVEAGSAALQGPDTTITVRVDSLGPGAHAN
jgi:hypothetical protein